MQIVIVLQLLWLLLLLTKNQDSSTLYCFSAITEVEFHLEVMEQLQPLFSCFSQIKGIFFSQIFGLQSLQKNSKCGRRQQ